MLANQGLDGANSMPINQKIDKTENHEELRKKEEEIQFEKEEKRMLLQKIKMLQNQQLHGEEV